MKKLSLLIALSCYITGILAQPTGKQKTFTKVPLTFIENKGQITDQYGHGRKDIRYKAAANGVSVFIGNGQLHYQWSKAQTKRTPTNKRVHRISETQDTASIRYTMYRLDMNLQGANPNPQVLAEDRQNYYENYHTTALHTDSATVNSYSKITYKNIYPGIDWVLYINDNKLEYDFIVNPGGNVNDIKIKYNGATDIAHNVGNININTPLGVITEQKLYAYEKETKKMIPSQFTLNKSGISFHTSDYKGTLVIDPTLAWGTYFGGTSRDVSYGNACDKAGNIYMCGFTESISNIATVGAYQTIYHGSEDAYITKFSGSGSVEWATYYGGENEDIAEGITCDDMGNLYITGETLSSTGISTAGSHQTIIGGSYDAFLAKFDSAGSMQWATYFGGANMDVGYSVTCDSSGAVYICGGTQSSSNIATLGSFMDTMPQTGGAFLAKFGGGGSIVWATYFSSGASACTHDVMGYIYIAGDAGANLLTTNGCFQDSCLGFQNCYIAKFDNMCQLQWSTYFGGNNIDYASGITCDEYLNVYISGLTNSTNGIASHGAYQTIYGGGLEDAFLAKFNDTGEFQWATYYGGSGDDEDEAMTSDTKGHILLSGSTTSADNIATIGSYQTVIGGGLDAFLASFSSSGGLVWASYYGGSSNDVALGVASDVKGNVYFSGYTASNSNISTPDSYQSEYADSIDAFLVKFDTGTTLVPNVTQLLDPVYLFPSPNDGVFRVMGNLIDSVQKVKIEIFDVAGSMVSEKVAIVQRGLLNQEIEMPSVARGTYFLKLSAGYDLKTIKFSVK